jgi:hypothetical protein
LTVRDEPNLARRFAKDVYCPWNWQRSPFPTGGVGATGIAIRHLTQLCGLILPCLMPERSFAPELARIDSLALVLARKEGKVMEDVLVASKETDQPRGSHATRDTTERGDVTGTPRRMWLWVVAILVSLPIAGYVADLVVDGVDSAGTALVGGLIVGAVIGAAEWFVLRHRVSWLWIPATIAGMAIGLVAGAALVDYGIGRADLVLMGAVNGLAVGVMQALVLARNRIPGALWWAVANPPAWALGWFVSSYVISSNIDERFPIFGASGALVFGLLTLFLLARLFRAAAPEVRGTAATAVA